MKTRQDFDLYRSSEITLRFLVEEGAGATDAQWFCAAQEGTPFGQHDLDLSTEAGTILLTDVGADCYADLTFTRPDTESLTPGHRYHELWVRFGGQSAPRAVGKVRVHDSLKA